LALRGSGLDVRVSAFIPHECFAIGRKENNERDGGESRSEDWFLRWRLVWSIVYRSLGSLFDVSRALHACLAGFSSASGDDRVRDRSALLYALEVRTTSDDVEHPDFSRFCFAYDESDLARRLSDDDHQAALDKISGAWVWECQGNEEIRGYDFHRCRRGSDPLDADFSEQRRRSGMRALLPERRSSGFARDSRTAKWNRYSHCSPFFYLQRDDVLGIPPAEFT
jgi:hypothetical protein